jgi:hypothetical protein
MRAGEMWPFNGALPVIEHRGAIRGRWKVAQHWCPTHELIDIPVTSLSVGRWPTVVSNAALQRWLVPQQWCPTPLSVGKCGRNKVACLVLHLFLTYFLPCGLMPGHQAPTQLWGLLASRMSP